MRGGWDVGAGGCEKDEKAKDCANNWYQTSKEFERDVAGREGKGTKGGWGSELPSLA